MKQLLLTIVFLGFTAISNAQYTQEGVKSMMTELGTDETQIETMYVGNIKEFYRDGTSKYSYSKYNKTYNSGTNKFFIDKQGITVKNYEGGKVVGVRTFNYAYIRTLKVEKDYIEIHLAN